jgi:hypothetical protein
MPTNRAALGRYIEALARETATLRERYDAFGVSTSSLIARAYETLDIRAADCAMAHTILARATDMQAAVSTLSAPLAIVRQSLDQLRVIIERLEYGAPRMDDPRFGG